MAVLNSPTLPPNYQEADTLDLNNKKEKLIVNMAALLIMVIMLVAALFIVPIKALFDLSDGFAIYALRFGIILAGTIVYMILHELVHGICMLCLSDVKPKYGFNGLYAYAGSTAYFNKKSYTIIALAPLVFWGVVLLILSLLVNESWFWVVYIIQLTNISGAAGDIYVTLKFRKLPEDVLLNDNGTKMTIYLPKSDAAEAAADEETVTADAD